MTRQPLNLFGHPDGIRQAVIEFFQTNSAVWDIQVQLCTNLETMPIEDASVTCQKPKVPIYLSRDCICRHKTPGAQTE